MYIKQNVNIKKIYQANHLNCTYFFLKKVTFIYSWLLFSCIDWGNVTQEGILLHCISSLVWCGDINNNSEDTERY